jgi:hypothetical protein
MDDGSSPALDTFDTWSIPRSALSFRYFPLQSRAKYQQTKIYNFCNKHFGNFHDWIGYIDVDEFVEIVERPGQIMAGFLQQYEQYGAFGISWVIHNSNGLLKRPESVRKGFTKCVDDGPDSPHTRHVKSFTQPKYTVEAESPHNFHLNESKIQVGENGDKFSHAWRKPVTTDKIALHHYVVKSREEMQQKIDRWQDTPKTWDFCKSPSAILCLCVTNSSSCFPAHGLTG